MKGKLKKEIFISRFNLIFPANCELNIYPLKGVNMVEHPKRTGVYCIPKNGNLVITE